MKERTSMATTFRVYAKDCDRETLTINGIPMPFNTAVSLGIVGCFFNTFGRVRECMGFEILKPLDEEKPQDAKRYVFNIKAQR
jgi:hypothetical protein